MARVEAWYLNPFGHIPVNCCVGPGDSETPTFRVSTGRSATELRPHVTMRDPGSTGEDPSSLTVPGVPGSRSVGNLGVEPSLTCSQSRRVAVSLIPVAVSSGSSIRPRYSILPTGSVSLCVVHHRHPAGSEPAVHQLVAFELRRAGRTRTAGLLAPSQAR